MILPDSWCWREGPSDRSRRLEGPEPGSAVLLLGGGALLCALARLRRSKLARGA